MSDGWLHPMHRPAPPWVHHRRRNATKMTAYTVRSADDKFAALTTDGDFYWAEAPHEAALFTSMGELFLALDGWVDGQVVIETRSFGVTREDVVIL